MKRGFTLVEIMIVVAIMMILVGMSIPFILRSRSVANEGAAVANLKAISDACQLYHSNRGSYPDSLQDLALPNSNPPYIDSALASGSKQGYDFIYAKIDLGFTVNANPNSVLRGRYYFIDETGTMRVNDSQQAGSSDVAVQ